MVLEVPRRYNLVVGLGLMKRRMSLLLMGRSGGVGNGRKGHGVVVP